VVGTYAVVDAENEVLELFETSLSCVTLALHPCGAGCSQRGPQKKKTPIISVAVIHDTVMEKRGVSSIAFQIWETLDV
jgi:hypothetical protein